MRLVWATTHGDLTESIRALEQGADPNLEDVVDPSDFVRFAACHYLV